MKFKRVSTRWRNCYRATIARAEAAQTLERILDIERLIARLTLGTAGPRELLALGRSLARIPELKKYTAEFACARLRELHEKLDEIAELREADSDGDRRGAAAEFIRRRNDSRRF